MQFCKLIPWLIITTGTICFWQMALIETPLVAQYWQNPDTQFRDFMAQSLYEGGGFGGSDIGVTLAVLCFLAWLRISKSSASNKFTARDTLKFIWLSSLVNGLLVVHSLKWLISRARPRIALTIDMPLEILSSITWPGFMPWNGPRGSDWNSFPSGHTASCAIMLAFVYITWTRHRLIAVLMFFCVATFCYFMGIARSMAGMHWLSDSIASFFLTWTVTHLLAIHMGVIKKQPNQAL